MNGAFNVNPASNLILTVRLTREVTMNKKARARQKFIHCDHFQKRFLERGRERESEGLKSFSKPKRENLIFSTHFEKTKLCTKIEE